jgi:uncharacterized protein (DUF697 family)
MAEPTAEDVITVEPIVLDETLVVDEPPAREEQARAIVRRYMFGNAAVGLIPIPLFDLVALTGVQMKMVHSLAELYGVDFSAELVKNSVVTMVGSLGSLTLGGAIAASAFKFIPIFGTTAAVLSLPVISAGITYAVGKVYIMHFEAGGTLLDFEPGKMHAYFKEAYSQGVQEARQEEAGKKKADGKKT